MASKSNPPEPEKPLQRALRAVPETHALIAKELRAMALGAGDDYRQFSYVARWIRNIWHAAADALEDEKRVN